MVERGRDADCNERGSVDFAFRGPPTSHHVCSHGQKGEGGGYVDGAFYGSVVIGGAALGLEHASDSDGHVLESGCGGNVGDGGGNGGVIDVFIAIRIVSIG